MSLSKMIKMGICALVLILFTINMVPLVTLGQTEVLEPQPEVEWTFMVYMDGDNNLEGPGVEDFNEMEEAFRYSTYQVNVLVQFDRIAGEDTSNGDWEDCKRFAIQKDYDKSEMTSEVVQEMGESNMGDPETLIDFVKWGFEYYPAKKYAVVLWDHGGAYKGVCWDDTNQTDGAADCITIPELKYALKEIKQANGMRNLDLLGFDACSMAQVAIMYEIQDYVDVGVASGFVEPGDGWPYERILPKLLSQPTMSKEELGTVIAEEFVGSYSDRAEDPQDSPRTSMTAFNLSMFPQFVQELNEFTVELSKVAGDHYWSIWNARKRALSYDMVPMGPFTLTNYCLTDITDFCMKIIDPDPGAPQDGMFVLEHPEVTKAAQSVIDAQKTATIKNLAYPPLDANPTAKQANGLTIYFPNDVDTVWDDRYDPLMFKHDMYWDDFLQSHWFPKKNAGNTPPTCLITYPRDVNETLNQDDLFIPVAGVAFDDEMVQTIEISIDGEEWMPVEMKTGDSVDWYFDLSVQDLEPGQHSIRARATDENDGKSPEYYTSIYVEEGEKEDKKQRWIPIDFNYLAIAIIISLIVLGVAILIRDKRKNYR